MTLTLSMMPMIPGEVQGLENLDLRMISVMIHMVDLVAKALDMTPMILTQEKALVLIP